MNSEFCAWYLAPSLCRRLVVVSVMYVGKRIEKAEFALHLACIIEKALSPGAGDHYE